MAEQLDTQAAEVSPVSVQEFSKKVKEKYPEYKDVDDSTLAQKIVEKYPEYKDKVKFDTSEPPNTGSLPASEHPTAASPVDESTQEPTYITKQLISKGILPKEKLPYGYSPLNETQPKEDQGFVGKLGSSVKNEFMTGLNQLNSWVADAPGFIYDLAGAPFRAVGLSVPTSKDFKDTPLENISDFYKNNAKAYEQKSIESNPDRAKGVVDLFAQGDIKGGILNLAGSIAQSTPSSLAMMLAGGATAPTILGGSAIFGAGKAQEIDQNSPEMNYDKGRIIAALNGTLEGVFETYLGSGAVAKSLSNIIKNEGKEIAKDQVKKSLGTAFADMITKNPWLAPLGEGFEEVGTQLAQNFVDKYSGYRPDLNLTDGVGDSFLAGVGMGGIHGAVIGLTKQAIDHHKQTPVTTAIIEGQQYTINNPEDLGQDGKPIFAKDANGNVIPVPNHKVENPVTQTVEQIDQAKQQEADKAKLYEGVLDPSAQVTDDINENNIRLVKFSNGQSKIITPEGEVIANNQEEEDRILEAVVNGEPLPQPKATEQGEVIEPAPEKKVVTQKFGNTSIDIIENEGYDEVVPSEKMPLDKALTVLEKKFKDNPRFEIQAEKVQVEEPGETKYDDPVKKTVIKSIRIVPKVTKNGNIENAVNDKVSEIGQEASDLKEVNNLQNQESSQNNQSENEKPLESGSVNLDERGQDANEGENTPPQEQGQGNEKGLEENVNIQAENPVVGESFTPGDPAPLIDETSKTGNNNNEVVNATENASGSEKPDNSNSVKKPRSISKVQQQASVIEVNPTSARDLALQYFINGGTINRNALETLYGNKTSGNKKVESERRLRFAWVKSDGLSIDELAHYLWEQSSHIEGNNLETSDFRDAIEDVIKSYTSPVQMAKDLIEAYNTNRLQYSDEQIEEMEMLGIIDSFNEPLTEEELELSSRIPEEIAINIIEGNALSEEQIKQLSAIFADTNTTINDFTNQANTESDQGNENHSPESIDQRIKGKESGSESQKELSPIQKEIQSLINEKGSLESEKEKLVKQVNSRNGLFGDIKAEPNDLFGGSGFDVQAGNRRMNEIDQRIATIGQKIAELTEKQAQYEATAAKENAGQQEIVIPEEPKFRSSDKPFIQEAIDQLQSIAPNAAPVVVIQSIDDVPQQVKNDPNYIANPKGIEAFWFNGKIYIFPEMVKSKDHLISIWIHENGLHNGIRNIIPARNMRLFMNRVYDSFYEIAKNNPEFQRIIERVEHDYRKATKQARAEEFLAYLSERVVSEKDLSPMEQSAWTKYLDMFRDFLGRLFNFNSDLLTEKQIVDITRFAVQSNFQTNEYADSNTGGNPSLRRTESDNTSGSEGRIGNESDNQDQVRIGQRGLTISDQAKEDLKTRHNALDAITRIGSELNIPINLVNSSELTTDNDQLAFTDNGTVTIVSDRVKSVSDVIKSLVKEVASENGIRGMLVNADPNSIIGKQLAKFDELPDGKIDIEKLAPIIRKAFRLTSGQFTNEDLFAAVVGQKSDISNNVQFRTSDKPEENNLIAVHNIKPAGLLNANRLGGLPMPSLAIVDINNGFDKYGDITLIADKNFIDPKQNRYSKVFASDVYSARYPSLNYVIPESGNKKIIRKVNDFLQLALSADVIHRIKSSIIEGGIRDLSRSDSSKLLFLAETKKPFEIKYNQSKFPESTKQAFIDNGWKNLEYYEISDNQEVKKQLTDLYFQNETDKDLKRFLSEDGILNNNIMRNFMRDVQNDIRDAGKVNLYETVRAADEYVRNNNLQDEFEAYSANLYDQIGVEEKIFRGYSNSGNRLYSPHTLENVLKEMKKDGIRGGEKFGYGAGSVRAHVTPEFKSLPEIQKNRGRIMPFEDDMKSAANNELIEVMDALKKFYKYESGSFGYYDNASEELVQLARSGRSESFKPIDAESRQMVADFLDKLANMPTEYFEAKINRGVSLAEFKNALIPESTSPEIKEILKFNGINAFEYKDNADRTEKLKELAEEKDLRFRIGEANNLESVSLDEKNSVSKKENQSFKDRAKSLLVDTAKQDGDFTDSEAKKYVNYLLNTTGVHWSNFDTNNPGLYLLKLREASNIITYNEGNKTLTPENAAKKSVKETIDLLEKNIKTSSGDLKEVLSTRKNILSDFENEIQQIVSGRLGQQPTSEISDKIEQQRSEVNTEPSDAQKEAGNYKMGHIRFDGFDISIENPKGSVRSGVDKQGNEWSQTLPADYGYFRGTVGKDKDHVDVFIGNKPEASNIYIIDQIDPETGKFDEHKVMLGFDSQAKAKQTYLAAFEPGWEGIGQITKTDKQGLKEWFEKGDQKKPFSDNVVRFKISGNPRLSITNVRGGWTEQKIIKELKKIKNDGAGYGQFSLLKGIAAYTDAQDLRDHLFYHGTGGGVSGSLYPSITMSEREAERNGGGGYGQRYFAISVSKSKRKASSFSGMSRSVAIYPVLLNKEAKVIDRPDIQDSVELEEIIVDLWNQSVDAVRIGDWTDSSSEQELAVINPYAISTWAKGEYHNVYGMKLSEITERTDEELNDNILHAKNALVEMARWKEEHPKGHEESLDEYWERVKDLPSSERLAERAKRKQITEEYNRLVRQEQERLAAPIRFRIVPRDETIDQLRDELDQIARFRTASTNDALRSVNETVESNMNESYGIKKKPFMTWLKEKMEELKKSTQHFEHITEKEFPEVYDKLRQFEAIPDRVKREAFERISKFVRPILKNEEHLRAFERYIVLSDLVHDIEETNLFDGKALPWGYDSIDEIKQDMRNVRGYVMRTPAVLSAIRERQAMMRDVKRQLVDAKLLKDNGNNDYFHHQVLAFMDDRANNVGVSSKDVRNHKKGWQRSRQGSIALYNTNYVQSEFEVMAQSLEQLAIKNLLGEINDGINIMPQLIEKAKIEGGSWREYIPDGYKFWYPKPGTNAYKAASMAEKAIQNILVDPNNPDFQAILAEAEGSMWVIPEQVAKQLDSMKSPEREMIYAQALRGMTNGWKQWTLLNPFRAAKYNFNNMSGDLDIVLAYDPNILQKKYAHTAMKETLADMKGQGMSEDMKEALRYGVIGSGLSVQEIPDITDHALFKSVTRGQGNFVKRAWGKTLGAYWPGVTAFTQFRENILRVASYKFFKDQINAGKKPFGVSNHDAIQSLYASGVSANEIAGKLARELMGDYGNLSQGGQWIRAHSYPFWSWVEVNAPRYLRLLQNTKFEQNSGVIGRVAGIGAKKTVVNVGMLGVRAMLMMGLVVLWNRIFFPDEDDELQKQKDNKLKLIIGRRDDGSVMTIKIQGAFSDVLSFFSLEDAVNDVKELKEGKSTIGKKAAESGSAFVNKFAQGAMPLTRATLELAMGKSLYPDVFNPTTIRDRGEHATRLVSMDKMYNYLTHKPVRSFGKEVSGLLVYDNNPGEAAYYTMRENIYSFLKDQGEESPSGDPTKMANALYYYKKSLRMGDQEHAKFWFDKYRELGGSAKGYKTSMKKGVLMNAVPKELRAKWLESLDSEDKEILDLANRWYLETYIKVGIPVNAKDNE